MYYHEELAKFIKEETLKNVKEAVKLYEVMITGEQAELFFPYQFLSTDPLFKNLFGEERFQAFMIMEKQKSKAF